MVGPVKEPYCRVHRENFPMLLVRNYSLTVNIRPLSPIQPNLSWVAFGVLPAVRGRTGKRNRKRRKVNPLDRYKQ
jgi:hypothetical protein